MTFEEYQKQSRQTAVYPDVDNNFIYPTLGLASEVGEAINKIKKISRDGGGVLNEEKKLEIKKELGDVLWYLSQLGTELKMSLEDIAAYNLEKLLSRKERGTLHGDGDNR